MNRMNDPRVRRALLVGGAVACLVGATFLLLLAVDVVSSRSALSRGDARYRETPAAGSLWSPSGLAPAAVTRGLLGVDDDVAFRRAVRAVRLSARDDPTDSDPEVVLRRAKAQALLQGVISHDHDPVRRSRAMNLLGVSLLSTPSADREERATTQRVALANLQKAIEVDPSNDDAKYNLEVVLRRKAGVQTVQGGPSPTRSGGQGNSRGAATGPPGKGY